jgi:hypothetical protein
MEKAREEKERIRQMTERGIPAASLAGYGVQST